MCEKNKGGRPKKQMRRYHLTRAALQQRRARVLEMRLAGIPPFTIAEELRKIPMFAGTKPGTVWNDITWWERQGQVTSVAPEVITPDIYFNARLAINIQAEKASRRFLVFQDQFDELAAELRVISEEYLTADGDRREAITARKETIDGDLAGLQTKAIRETRLILSIIETLTDIPKKLGLIIDKAQVGFYDETKQAMIEAIKNAPTAEARKELIRAAELFGRAFASS